MGKAAKKILDGLRAAKVAKAWQERAQGLIDEAPDWDAEQAKEIEAIVRYVCGAEPELPALSKRVLEHDINNLLRGLSRERALDAWDLRALDVLVRGRTAYWFWELDSWLRARVVKFPAEPIFDEALVVFRAHGLWSTDREIINSMVGHLTGHVTPEGALTSTGRWLLVQLDRDAAAVFAIARTQKDGKKTVDETSSLYKLLLGHRRALFDQLVPTLKLGKDSAKSFLAEAMLKADAPHYEQAAVTLMAGLTDPIPAVLSARNLETYFPGRYPADVKRLLLATIQAKGTSFLCDGKAADTRELAYEMAWRVLGDEATELWTAYREENDAIRLRFYATIERQAKTKALPWLIDGLVYPKDPKVEYGFVTHAKYVTRMVELLAGYDLSPYRDRIEATFRGTTNKKIKEQINKLLGKPLKAAAKRATRKPFAGKDGYRFDVYAAAVTKAALAAVKKRKRLPAPIQQVKLTGDQGEVQLNVLVIEGVGDPVEIALTVPRCKVPVHLDLMDDDPILAKFCKRHGLGADDDVPAWGDMYKLPWCALLDAQLDAAHAIVTGLAAQGHEIAKSCKVGVGEHDNFWQQRDGFDRKARAEVAALPDDQQADFAAVCFEDPDRQRRLLAR